MENKIKMIGLDLDGTVFTSNKTITRRTMKVIEEAVKAGVIVLPATGRPLAGIPKQFLSLKGITYALTANGARIVDIATNEVLYKKAMDYKTAGTVISKLNKLNVMCDAFIDGVGYAEEKSFQSFIQTVPEGPVKDYIVSTRRMVEGLYKFLSDRKQEPEKITIHFKQNTDGSLIMFDEVSKALKEVPGILAVSGAPMDLEVTKEGVTKGSGLLALSELLGIQREEVMAIGDSGNDKDMVLKAGLGIAMANASPDLLEAADFVTKSNDEDGVAYAIERFVLGSVKN